MKKRKIVINVCYGGFGLSNDALQEYRKRKNLDTSVYIRESDIARDDPTLISIIEECGTEVCSSRWAKLKIVEIPSTVKWEISEYDGYEHVAECHRKWG